MVGKRLTIFGYGLALGLLTGIVLPLFGKNKPNKKESMTSNIEEQSRQVKDKLLEEALNMSKTMKEEVGKLLKEVEHHCPQSFRHKKSNNNPASKI